MKIEKKSDLDSLPFMDGSYDPTYIYKAKMLNQEWRDAKIVEVKPLKEDEENYLPRKPSDFRYYMHFFGINRRNDDWVMPNDMIKTPYLVSQLKKFKKGNAEITSKEVEYFEKIDHSEEEGLDQKDQENHEKYTKVKTISRI